MSAPTSVYRYLDADGVLIYVGITNRGVQRQAEHVVHSKWWRFVRSQDVEHYDDRETAERRERHLIEKHQPPFNVQHNAEHKRRLAAYLKHTDISWERCGHCYGCLLAASPDPEDARSEDAICRLLMTLAEDEEPSICSVCNRPECAYQDGIDVGMEEGYRVGRHAGASLARKKIGEEYRDLVTADEAMRLVIDGPDWHATAGYVSYGNTAAEEALRRMEAAIAERGVTALVDEVARRDPWAVAS